MITSSYSDYQVYTQSVSESITPYPGEQQITPSSPITRETAYKVLSPKAGEKNLKELYPNKYGYVSIHTSSGENRRMEQGWTETAYTASASAGGMVRNALLSGSYGEFRKLRVDSEINSETISTSWSASVGENLHVGNAVGVAGYLQLGNSGNLEPGASNPGQEITRSFAPNSEGIDDLRLIVSDSALVQKDLYVKKSASISGPLKVDQNISCSQTVQAANLVSIGNSEIRGDLTVSGATRTEDLYVYNTASIPNLIISDSVHVIGDLQVQGSSSLRDTVILGNLLVDGTASYLNVENLYVKDKMITVASGSTTPSEADGAGLSIDGAGVEFTYDAEEDSMYLNRGLKVEDLDVEGSGYFEGTVFANGDIRTDGDFKGNSLYVTNSYVSNSLHVGGDITSSRVYSTFYGDGSHLTNITASVASSSTWKTYVDFEAESYQRVTHPFKTTDVFVQVYRWDDPNYHPNLDSGSSFSGSATLITNPTIRIIDTSSIDVGYAEAVNGYVVISDAGMMITGSIDVFDVTTERAEYDIDDPTAIYRFSHKLGTENLIVTVYQYADTKDGLGTIAPVQIFPEQISIPDNSHVDIVFGRAPIQGYIVIAKAGHVIKAFDILDFIESYNIHYGTEGDWAANSFTAVSGTAEVVTAQEYVDTPRVGNRETGPQYAQSQSWETYMTFNSQSIDSYIKNPEDPDTARRVSNLDQNGNLRIRGNLYTNENFSTSDIRKKKDVEVITNALEDLEQIQGVRFNWKDSGEPSMGVVAQNVQTIYPELTREVETLDDGKQLIVNYNGLVGVLIEAVKELSAKVKELEKQNENR